MRAHLFNILFAASLCLAGCHQAHGIRQGVILSGQPSASAVEEALRAVPDVQTVEHRFEPRRTYWSLAKGKVREPAYDFFSYRGVNGWGNLEVARLDGGRAQLEIQTIWTQRDFPSEKIIATVELLNNVCAGLHSNLYGVPPPQTFKKEFIKLDARSRAAVEQGLSNN